jgi:hypothetical protein
MNLASPKIPARCPSMRNQTLWRGSQCDAGFRGAFPRASAGSIVSNRGRFKAEKQIVIGDIVGRTSSVDTSSLYKASSKAFGGYPARTIGDPDSMNAAPPNGDCSTQQTITRQNWQQSRILKTVTAAADAMLSPSWFCRDLNGSCFLPSQPLVSAPLPPPNSSGLYLHCTPTDILVFFTRLPTVLHTPKTLHTVAHQKSQPS